MSRVVALIPDLLFGSKLLGALRAAGLELELVGDASSLQGPLTDASVLIVDLTGELDGPSLLDSLRAEGSLAGVKTLGFYSHVDAAMRKRGEEAGFDLVVPRSRMAREAASLVAALADASI